MDKYTNDQVEISDMCKALAHPARVAIIEYLIAKNECVCGEIVDELPLSQSTVSQHLKELKKVGLIQGTVSGPKTCYCIDPDTWAKFSRMISPLFIEIETKLTCC